MIASFLVRKGHRQGTFRDYLAWAIDHWACWIDQHDILPLRDARNNSLSPYDRDMTRFFFSSAIEANLKHYVAHKLTASPHLISRSFWQRPVLDRALRPSPWTKPTYRIDPGMIDLLLTRGANPNMTLTLYNATFDSSFLDTSERAWTTVWGVFLQSLHDAERAKIRKPPDLIQDEFEATKLMIEHGAAADLRPWRISASEVSLKHFRGTALTPSDIFHEVFPPRDAVFLDQLLKKHRAWPLQRICSWGRRSVLLCFHHEINLHLCWLASLLSILFKGLGVDLPKIYIPTSLYGLSLVWPGPRYEVERSEHIYLPIRLLGLLGNCNVMQYWLAYCLMGVILHSTFLMILDYSKFRPTPRVRWIGGIAQMAFEDPENPTPNPPSTRFGVHPTSDHRHSRTGG